MGVHGAPESAAAAHVAAAVFWPVSSSKKQAPADIKLTYRPSVKHFSHSAVSLPPRHTSMFAQLQSINNEVKDIFQWRMEATHEPTL